MQTFFTLSSKQAKDFDKPLYVNARDLLRDASLLVDKNNSYNRATSLLVLSLEELVKAILVKMHSESLQVYDLKDAKFFFSQHKIRHQVAQLLEMGYAFYEAVEKWQKKGRKGPLQSAGKLLQVLLIAISTNERIKKLKKFNDYKNNGFYVGYRDRLLDPKQEIGESEFYEVKEAWQRCRHFYKLLCIIYHPKLENHLSRNRINEIHGDLELFINEAMSEYSFSLK
ncbi:abortive infection protein, AbiV family [Salegentibacter agarivorans]|uniref:Abortive infection protein, AbiV family n=1 Tax=Salegentibacter agarivorans TaxID=345907 RepID=A0A1I2Q2V3_9FLAO|nr:AbiV family abortive infection protein [Salegentibacter agarivorans]SFG22628.1 abortive infection protein, AbiV family [Salegentibacter agarivorans]